MITQTYKTVLVAPDGQVLESGVLASSDSGVQWAQDMAEIHAGQLLGSSFDFGFRIVDATTVVLDGPDPVAGGTVRVRAVNGEMVSTAREVGPQFDLAAFWDEVSVASQTRPVAAAVEAASVNIPGQVQQRDVPARRFSIARRSDATP